VRGALAQNVEKLGQYSFKLRQHIIVPEPHDEKLICNEPMIPSLITPRFRVLPAIHLDHEARVVADEIRDERSNGHLPPKLVIRKSPITQRKPELSLGVCHVRA
jgi:hypothetical protein